MAHRYQAHRRRSGPGPLPGEGTIAPNGSTTVTPSYGRLRRRLLLTVLAVVLVAALVAVGVVVWSGDGAADDPADRAAATLPAVGEPDPVLAALSTGAPAPDPDVLATRLTPLLAAPALLGGVSAEVVDVASGQTLFDQEAGDPVTPASTAKLLTAVATLTTLDPADTLETRVVAGATPDEVVLVGGGDPTLSTTAPSLAYPGAATVADLATQVQAALPPGTTVSRVVVDNSLFEGPLTAEGWGPEDAPSSYAAPVTATAVDGARVTSGENPRSGQPGTDAGAALAAALGAPRATVQLGPAPDGAATLGSVRSAPVTRLVEQALSQSDNLLAESLARHVALARGLPATFEGAAQGVTDALEEAGVDVSDVDLYDGSGLSRLDLVTPDVLTDLVTGAADGSLAGTSAVLSGLAVAGYDGTLFDRGDDDPATAPGAIRGKTGTLLGVHALAGTVVTADGRLLAYALVANGTSGGGDPEEAALDAVASTLAACGCS
ncbi:D-alanyl-D-alanine carboxypeptidase/D-alanyl-D-alanine-endopeptidase (penicillin-binding protein 4) [Geodermatophilus bullaregiensis]|uniref:D-alanyl-D-alanine carboxypeptidase/D-alanyl-D-alanine endopeptidase n=1 Tax=Geodermatophilus bullaregiensis TaxID=1564160 RepID=UPI0027DD27EE|nr:D-alanyl-D-alanine carboxypeptidase/D-alanyl-D-alanine-endopeptidase [Geodermatophilus bullaregiensis]MBM7807206.1 D-alanyl-D-alanine carboxypeptidase/D-alanyl-D-alanine-endopeptidase (penicillin-binding protein 4) [Geodermatophilus bullaregiensis]